MTRHVYGFEDRYLTTLADLNKQQSLRVLVSQAKKIWQKHYSGSRAIPTIKFGKGDSSLGRPLSYTLGYSEIVLCPKQRNLLTLIHELVHAIGPCQHGRNFVKVYVTILDDFVKDKHVMNKIHNEFSNHHKRLYNRHYK